MKDTAEQSLMEIVTQAFSVEVLLAMHDLEILGYYLRVQPTFVEHATSLMIVYAQHLIQQQVGHSLKSSPNFMLAVVYNPFAGAEPQGKIPMARGPPITHMYRKIRIYYRS